MSFNFHTPLTDKTSYGIVAINIGKNIDCNIVPMGSPSGNIPKGVMDKITTGEIDLNLPTVKLYHQFDLGTFGRFKRIGYPIFELDKFNHIEIANLKSCDELWACSKWAKNVVESNGVNVPTHIVPLGVDSSIFYPVEYGCIDYIFLSAGKWEIRKSQNEIVQAFNKAFTVNDDVQLWLSMHNQFLGHEFINTKKQEYLSTPMGKAGRIKFVGPFNRQQDLARIMNMTNCGVFPSKAEGWGLETLEMMACGKTVIVTDYAGHTEYCDENNSTLIPIDSLEPAIDNKWFFGQGNWAKFNIDYLVSAMRENFRKGPTLNQEGLDTAKKFSWVNTAKKIEEIL